MGFYRIFRMEKSADHREGLIETADLYGELSTQTHAP